MESGVTLVHLCLLEERNERLIGGRLEEELQRVAIVIDPLQRADDGLEKGTPRDYGDVVRYCWRQTRV